MMKNLMSAIFILLTITILTNSFVYGSSTQDNDSLLIVVTFPSLVDDVQQLLCNDAVISLVPPGTDPHNYHLKPKDIELLKRADLIVSSAHTFFELKIRELKMQGLLKAVLIEIPRIPDIVILRNPDSRSINLHMPIYDLDNYRRFLLNLTMALITLNPDKSACYIEHLNNVLRKLSALHRYKDVFRLRAIADLPYIQYAVSWLGIEVVHIVMVEHGIELIPKHLQAIEQELSSKTIDLVLVSKPSNHYASEWLIRIARRYGIPIVYVPTPMSRGTIVEKLSYVLKQLKHFNTTSTSTTTPSPNLVNIVPPQTVRWTLFVLYISMATLILLIYTIRSRGGTP